MPRVDLLSTLLTFSLCSALVSASVSQHERPNVKPRQPNLVFIMTDDQDLHLDSLDYMPKLQKLIGDEGTFFRRHYCTIAVCCPSRVSLMTGKLAHNTNVTDVNPPYGKNRHRLSIGLPGELNLFTQVDIPNLCPRATTMTTCPFGCRRRATTPTIRASSSMRTRRLITTNHTRKAGIAQIVCYDDLEMAGRTHDVNPDGQS